jgi:hypothetical protein
MKKSKIGNLPKLPTTTEEAAAEDIPAVYSKTTSAGLFWRKIIFLICHW